MTYFSQADLLGEDLGAGKFSFVVVKAVLGALGAFHRFMVDMLERSFRNFGCLPAGGFNRLMRRTCRSLCRIKT